MDKKESHIAAGERMEAAKILLVDDETEVTKILSKRLGRRGYECQTAANGQEAVEAMRQFPFGVVVMDVKMPVMDGMERLHSAPRRDCLPFLIVALPARPGSNLAGQKWQARKSKAAGWGLEGQNAVRCLHSAIRLGAGPPS